MRRITKSEIIRHPNLLDDVVEAAKKKEHELFNDYLKNPDKYESAEAYNRHEEKEVVKTIYRVLRRYNNHRK